MAQLPRKEIIGGGSLCLWSGFPVICLNSKELNLKKLLNSEKQKNCVARTFDKFEILKYFSIVRFYIFTGDFFLLPLKNLLNLTHRSHFLAADQALMPHYGKALRKRRFPQDAVAYVLLSVWSLDMLRAVHKLPAVWMYWNLWGLHTALCFLFALCGHRRVLAR